MPVVKALMGSLRKKYGVKTGERVYYAMEAEGKGPFAKGNKHHDLHVAYATKLGQKPIERKRKKQKQAKRKTPSR
ncbi:MAG: hypothetical protein DRP42_05065 [Tenericutes bacterium]|nr:MAG: hypothetical protein DRP42_05065 [Mycoplasmatota bacterium]